LIVSAIGLVFLKELLLTASAKEAWWLVRIASGFGFILTLAAVIHSAWEQNRLASENDQLQEDVEILEDQVEELNELVASFGSDYFDLWDNRLKVLAEELSFDARDRISVYRHEHNSFTMIGRYSMLPELDKPGRSVYPVDQGVIGVAWASGNGQAVAQDLPDPNLDIEAYCARAKDSWGIPAGVTKKMSMKSRSIAAFALNNSDNSTRDAIIVFESTDPDRFDVSKLEERVKGAVGKDIVHILKILKDKEPSLDFAAARGF